MTIRWNKAVELSFEQLKSMVVFAHVVEQGSFNGAAKKMGLSRAVVSYHVKKLEKQLDVRLLNRSTRSISLTQAGASYYQSCKIIAEQAQTANQQIEDIKEEPAGRLKITCPVNVGLQSIVPALNEFMKQYPKIEIDLMLTDDIVNIMKEGMDLAIRGAALADSSLQASKLAILPTCLCASPDYLLTTKLPLSPVDLAEHQWVVYKLSSGVIELSKGKRAISIAVKGNVSTNNAAARTAFVEAGHGIARIPLYDALPKIKTGSLVQLLTDYQLKDIEVYAVYPPGTANTKKLRLLISHLQDYFSRIAH